MPPMQLLSFCHLNNHLIKNIFESKITKLLIFLSSWAVWYPTCQYYTFWPIRWSCPTGSCWWCWSGWCSKKFKYKNSKFPFNLKWQSLTVKLNWYRLAWKLYDLPILISLNCKWLSFSHIVFKQGNMTITYG